jgi:hypothetical protein
MRAEHAHGHPAQGLHVAQAARAFLEVGLEVIGGVAEACMAGALFVALGEEIFARRPRRCGAIASPSARTMAASAASGRASICAVRTVMSSRAALVHSSMERTAWPTGRPASHNKAK